MRRRLATILALAVFAALPRLSAAQVTPAGGTAAGDDTQPATSRVGATIFYDYTFQKAPKTTDAAGNTISANSFNVSRAYLNATGSISHVVTYRITADINATRFAQTGDSTNNLNGSLVFRLKYAFAQMSLTDWTGKWTGSWVRAGIQQTPFIDYEEGIYRYRFQGMVFAERDGGLSSSDAGASFHSNLPMNYGDFQVGVYNGENYNKPEANNQKALQARFTLRPMPTGSAIARGLRVTVFQVADHVVQDAVRNRTLASVTLEQKRFNVNVDILAKKSDQALPTSAVTKQDGYSFFLTPFFKEKGNGWEALVRYDSLRPDVTNASTRRQNPIIAGIAYWFPHPGGAGTAAIMLDYEQQKTKNPATATPTQQKVFVHGLISF